MFALPDLLYAYDALEPFIDEETMHVHHDGHHATYVKNLNDALDGYPDLQDVDVETLLKSLDKVPEEIRTKVQNNAGGHFHHSFFWKTLEPGNKEPSTNLLEVINKTFGSLDNFKEEFNKQALAVFGSGWTWLVSNGGKLEIINTPNQDSPVSQGMKPILALDLWEHAYYLKFKNKRAEYIQSWWNVVNWAAVEKNLQQAA